MRTKYWLEIPKDPFDDFAVDCSLMLLLALEQ